LNAIGTVARVDYAPGLSQPGQTHSGVGVGLGYNSKSGGWHVMASYGYGFQAIRSTGQGAQSVGILCQIDLEARQRNRPIYDPSSPSRSWGLFHFLDRFF